MAKMSITGTKELMKQLSKLEDQSPKIAERAVRFGADIVADDIRKRLESDLSTSKITTGDLLKSLGISPANISDKGVVDVKIGFSGYDRKGVPNHIKAAAKESGTSKQPKKPFIRPSVNANRKKVRDEMERVVDEAIKKIT